MFSDGLRDSAGNITFTQRGAFIMKRSAVKIIAAAIVLMASCALATVQDLM